VEDQSVSDEDPVLARDAADEVLLDLHRLGLQRQAEAVGESGDVGVDDDADGDGEGGAEHHVGRLARYAGEGQQLFHRPRHLAAVDVA